MLKFEIVSSRTVDGVEAEKKFVAYMLQVRQDVTQLDPDPANVERRYTHFLDLFNGLKKENPALLNTISFPRKMLMGNFDPNLISVRCTAFESLLSLIANESRLRDSPAAIAFFQDVELNDAKRLINENKFDQALSVLETSFKLLNKVYTDRSRVVLCALCRIVACAGASGGALAGPVERWAQLALKRYEAVSDSDLLLIYIPLLYTCINICLIGFIGASGGALADPVERWALALKRYEAVIDSDLLLIYIPLLHTCIHIWETLGRDKSKLVEELNDLRKKGMKVDSFPSLMEAVDNLNTVVY